VSGAAIDRILEAAADFVDLKSPFFDALGMMQQLGAIPAPK
jgi:hypothetical protein